MPKFHKISWEQFEKYCIELAKKVRSLPASEKVDKIVAISRGGLVPARILSDLLSIPISHITISSYRDLQQKKETVIEEIPTRSFKGETILLVDEIADSGKTFKMAVSYFNQFPVKKIYCLSVVIKSHTKPLPEFWGQEIDAWVIFPYELNETYEAFLKLFGNNEEALIKLLEVGFEKWEVESIT